ncbi:hypothetical protein B0H14DRAFT_2775031, partial [Mycena olivaceomarginata]
MKSPNWVAWLMGSVSLLGLAWFCLTGLGARFLGSSGWLYLGSDSVYIRCCSGRKSTPTSRWLERWTNSEHGRDSTLCSPMSR